MEGNSREQRTSPEAPNAKLLGREKTGLVEFGKKRSRLDLIRVAGLTLFSTFLVEGALSGQARADTPTATTAIEQIVREASHDAPFRELTALKPGLGENTPQAKLDAIMPPKVQELSTPGQGFTTTLTDSVKIRTSIDVVHPGAFGLVTFEI